MSYSKFITCVFCSLLATTSIAPMQAMAQDGSDHEKILIRAKNQPLVSLKKSASRAGLRAVVSKPAREVPNFRFSGRPSAGGSTSLPDAIVQESDGEQITVPNSGFFGASNNDNQDIAGFMIAPPDTDGQVGKTHFVQMINLLTTIFDKDGDIIDGPFTSDAFWTDMDIDGNCKAYNQGDPIVLYDEVRDRWLVSQFAFPDSLGSFSQCVAISSTEDPTGGWHRYEFDFNDYGMNDYPKHGIVSDSITMMANLFTSKGRNFRWGGTFLGVMDKEAMYEGLPARLIGFNIGSAEFGFVAGDLDGGGNVPALFGTAMSTTDHFDIWQVDVDWNSENASVQRIASVPVTPFDSELCSDSRGACIPQPESGPLLESLSDRLMHRLQIRDFGAYRTMVTAHTVDVGGGRAGIRWYELRENDGSNWALYQEGTFAPADDMHRFMPSAAMNSAGDIGIGYLLAGTSTYVSVAVAGQTASATESGILNAEELICAAGSGVQEGVSRSGDYSSTSIDPLYDTFWHTNEVFTQTGDFQWNTFVCEFAVADKGSGGNTPPVANFDDSCVDLDCSFTDESYDTDGTVTNWAWDFGDGGSSTMQNPDHTYATAGDYSVTLQVTDNEGATDSQTRLVTVDAPVGNLPPTAAFTFECTDLDCTFTDNSVDTDGSILSWSWDFGDDEGSSTNQNSSYRYGEAGSYGVTLSVTDDDGATDSASETVTVSAGSESELISSAVMTSSNRWQATVTDTSGEDLLGTWSSRGTASCSAAVCTLSNIHRRISSVTFTATAGPNTGEQITILKP